jgi:KDO2-lipid IV(A) lauroyltransferase
VKTRLRIRLINLVGCWSASIFKTVFRPLPWALSFWLGDRLGDVMRHIAKGTRERILSNLQAVFDRRLSGMEREIICRRWFHHVCRSAVECLKLSPATLSQLGDRVVLDGEEHLRQALAVGRGVILVTGHFGNYEYLAAVLCHKQYPLHAFIAPNNAPAVRDLHRLYGLKEIEMESGGVRTSLQVLHRGEMLTMLIDWNITPKPVYVEFLGHLTPLPSGAATLALKTGAAVLFACIVRQADNTHRLIIHPPFHLIKTGSKDGDVQENMRQFIQPLESYVKTFPEQWVAWRSCAWAANGTNLSPKPAEPISYLKTG